MGHRMLAHAHSTWSFDGTLTLAEWRTIARERGCSAVLLAEHEEPVWSSERYATYVEACARASDDDVRLVPGVEFNQDGRHVLCYGLTQWPERPSSIEALAQAVHAQGCLLCLAHPGRYRWSYPSCLVDGADAIEVWNSSWVCDGDVGPHPRTIALARTHVLLAGQDVHARKHLGTLYLRTTLNDPLEALRCGAFEIEHRGRIWPRDRLLGGGLRGFAQRWRTQAVWGALASYRLARRSLRRLPIPFIGRREHRDAVDPNASTALVTPDGRERP